MPKNYLLIYSEQLATEIELLCQNINASSNTLFGDFEKQLALRQRQYNNFPMRPLNWKSPKHVLFSFPDV